MAWLVFAGTLMLSTTVLPEEGAVLVFGGTGRLGAPIVELLLEAGETVTVFTRPGSDRARLNSLNVDYAVGDLLEAESVAAAFQGRPFRAVIDASARRGTDDLFYDTAMNNILAGAQGTDVKQIIYHSSVGAGDNMEAFPRASWGRMRNVLLAKGRAEQALEESGIDYTIIRNGLLQRSGTPSTGSAYLTEDQTVMGVITRADLALLTMECLYQPGCLGKIYHAVDDTYEIPEAFR